MMMTTRRVLEGTQPAASLHWRSVAEDTTEIDVTYVTSFTAEMHVAKLKTGATIGSVKRKNNTIKGTMITMVLTMTNLTGSGHKKQDISQDVSRHTPET
jgi:hypothetical protein